MTLRSSKEKPSKIPWKVLLDQLILPLIIPSENLHAGTTLADTQEETLQPESSEIEYTSLKQVDRQEDHITGHTEVQNTGDTDKRAVPDYIGSQTPEDGTTPENDSDDYISDDQDPTMQDDQTSKAS